MQFLSLIVSDKICHQLGFDDKLSSNLYIEHSSCSIRYKFLLVKLLISSTTFWRHGFKEYALWSRYEEDDFTFNEITETLATVLLDKNLVWQRHSFLQKKKFVDIYIRVLQIFFSCLKRRRAEVEQKRKRRAPIDLKS